MYAKCNLLAQQVSEMLIQWQGFLFFTSKGTTTITCVMCAEFSIRHFPPLRRTEDEE